MNSLAVLNKAMKKYDAALALYKQCLDGRNTVLGAGHPDTIKTMNNTAALLFELERYPEAEKLYKHCYETRKKMWGSEDPRTLNSMISLAAVYQKTEKRTEAGKNIKYFLCILIYIYKALIHNTYHVLPMRRMALKNMLRDQM